MQRLIQKCGLHSVVVQGCRVNLRHEKSGRLLKKGWRLVTTCKRMAERMQLPCMCNEGYEHARCEGLETRKSSFYTPEFAKRVAQVLVQEQSHYQALQEGRGVSSLSEGFGEGSVCRCSESCTKDEKRLCGMCSMQMWNTLEGSDKPSQETEAEETQTPEHPGALTVEEYEALISQEALDQIESLAHGMISQQKFSYSDCEQLIQQLPLKPVQKHRQMLGDQRVVYLVLGLFSYGNQYGVTRKTELFPQVTQYLNHFLHKHNSQPLPRTSLVVSFNNQLPLHTDRHNVAECDNCLIGLGKYSAGGLWVQHSLAKAPDHQNQSIKKLPNGKECWGTNHETRHRVARFRPHLWHATEPWEGDRIVLTSYVSRGIQKVGDSVKQGLRRLGFELEGIPSRPEGFVLQEPQEALVGERAQKQKEEARIMKQLYLLHAATGHGSNRVMIEALKRRNASARILELAQQFKCSVCHEKQRVPTRNLASLETLPPKWQTITADIGHWFHPGTGEHVQFMLVIDEGSRFRIGRILSRGSKQQPNAATCLDYLREGWVQIFGWPGALRLDPSGAFRSQQVQEFCDRHSIHLDLIPADAHWQIGVCEQAVQGTKQVMDKICQDHPDSSAEEALATAIHTFNSREQIRGFSPIQHAFGRNPDTTGRLFNREGQLSEAVLVESADHDFERTVRARASAEKALCLCDWVAQQRITRALNSRSRPVYDYQPGELVYFWRSQESGKGRRKPGGKHGRFLGPARILAVETRKDPEGNLRQGSAVWLVRGRALLKCCPEQLRRASEREELLEAIAKDSFDGGTPWTYNKVVEEIGGNQYEDISDEKPEVEEWHRAQDPSLEEPPLRMRIRRKRPSPPDMDPPQPTEAEEPSQPSQPSRNNRARPTGSGFNAEAWWTTVPDHRYGEARAYWAEPIA